MIRLELKDYCHDCVGFEADVKGPSILYYTDRRGEDGREYVSTDTVIRCKHGDRCAHIVKYIMEGCKEKEQCVNISD